MNRHEYKYLIHAAQDRLLREKVSLLMMRDRHAGADGRYVISSLYFDDLHAGAYLEKENGEADRDKYRIRLYGHDRSLIRLERKSRRGDLTGKVSCSLSEETCRRMMRGQIPESGENDLQTMLFEEMRLKALRPCVIVTYEREPYVYPAGNVRVTFDRAITSSDDIGAFLENTCHQRPVMDGGMTVLEVKWDAVLPQHIRQVLQTGYLQRTAFSKFYYAMRTRPGGVVA